MTALFYCSACEAIDPQYNEAARHIVRAAALRGYTIVSGGTVKGTMRVVCEAALQSGAPTKGVLPRFMKGLEYPGMTRTIWTETMSERKEAMREGVDIAIALPGGIGTMDELAAEYEGRATVAKCNVDDAEDVAAQFGIRNIPTLIFVKNGQVVDRTVGVVPKADLKARIEANL